MLKPLTAFIALALPSLATRALADSWTDGQAEWARHGSHHGRWDCDGKCPEGRGPVRSVRQSGPPLQDARPGGGFNGAWTVSAGGYCASAGTSQVVIFGGRVSGQNLTGTVSPGGAVHTVGVFNGMSIVSNGHISGELASGFYQQSDGCSGSWSAYRS